MKQLITYRFVLVPLLAALLAGCGKQLNKRVTLWRNDKIPYGTYYAYQNLEHLFPNAVIETSDRSPVSFYAGEESSSAYVIIGITVEPDEKEWRAILNHAIAGNHVFISAINFGQIILDSFQLRSSAAGNIYYGRDSLTVRLSDPVSRQPLFFTYPGFSLANHFTAMDSSVTRILGRDARGNANFLKFTYKGGGTILLHAAPAALTNFFLLHRDNKRYYDLVFSSLPDTVTKVRWDDYYRYHVNGKNNTDRSAFSKLGTFLKNEVLRWAFWLTLILFLIVYLFESKRKQRAIPVRKQLNNTSLDFVKTIGRLYYQRKDNKNLAQKIAAHFLSQVRTRYNLQTSVLNDEFEEKLSYKSGYSLTLVKEIVQQIRSLEDTATVTDDELLALNDKIDNFINKA